MSADKSNQISRTSISILISDLDYKTVVGGIDDLMFKRTPFLEMMLPKYVNRLNKEQKFDYKKLKRRAMHRRSEPGHSIKALNLDTKLVDLINEVCKKKNCPRDLFFEAVFEAIDDVLATLGAVMESDVFDDSALAPSAQDFSKHLHKYNE